MKKMRIKMQITVSAESLAKAEADLLKLEEENRKEREFLEAMGWDEIQLELALSPEVEEQRMNAFFYEEALEDLYYSELQEAYDDTLWSLRFEW